VAETRCETPRLNPTAAVEHWGNHKRIKSTNGKYSTRISILKKRGDARIYNEMKRTGSIYKKANAATSRK
jgi:hypothetical protein